jgi:hypothetical protein
VEDSPSLQENSGNAWTPNFDAARFKSKLPRPKINTRQTSKEILKLNAMEDPHTNIRSLTQQQSDISLISLPASVNNLAINAENDVNEQDISSTALINKFSSTEDKNGTNDYLMEKMMLHHAELR